MKNVMSLYRALSGGGSDATGPSEGKRGGRKKARGKRPSRAKGRQRARSPVPSSSEEEYRRSAADRQTAEDEERDAEHSDAAEDAAEGHEDAAEGHQDDEQQASGEADSENTALWQRGPSQLPRRPILEAHRPQIAPVSKRYVIVDVTSTFPFHMLEITI